MKKNDSTINMVKEEFDSSTIKSAMYNYHTKNLSIKFKNDRIYTYLNVDDDTYRQFSLASSQGKAFNELIKDKFKYIPYSDEGEYLSEVKDFMV